MNYLGNVKDIDYSGGATTITCYKNINPFDSKSKRWSAFTLGNYIIGDVKLSADPNTELFQHEYGHTLQINAFGWRKGFGVDYN